MDEREFQVGELPEGRCGVYEIKRFTVSKDDERTQRMRCAFQGTSRFVPAGSYTALKRIGCHNGTSFSPDAQTEYAGTIVMSDTPDEIRDTRPLYYAAQGEVLINGLGLGCTVKMCMSKPDVSHVTVIEISPDIISLVGEFWKKKYGKRLTIINHDALTYKPPKGSYYGAVWHDIWDNIGEENLPDMKLLHRRYGRFATWQGSWARHLCNGGRC